jgi:hypothetical protein
VISRRLKELPAKLERVALTSTNHASFDATNSAAGLSEERYLQNLRRRDVILVSRKAI